MEFGGLVFSIHSKTIIHGVFALEKPKIQSNSGSTCKSRAKAPAHESAFIAQPAPHGIETFPAMVP